MEYDFQKSEDMKKELQDKVLLISESFKENPETIAEFLKFKTKFYNYSSRNTMLIFQQNPGAVFCNSFKAFKDLGYSVKKGEHGMKILVPTLKTYLNVNDEWIALSNATAKQKALYKQGKIQSQQKLFFKIGTVFDITQTNCPSEDYPKYLDIGYSSAQHAQLYDTLKKYCEQELECTVRENNLNSVALRGYYNYTTNEIAISGAFEDTTRLSILSHEMGHAIIHNSPESRQRPTVQKEFEADALSVMLHTYMGVEIAEVRERHLFESYQAMITDINYKPEMLNQSLERANQAFIQVTESINKELRPELKQTISKELPNKSTEQNQTQSATEKTNQKPEQKQLDKELIRRANESSLTDMGDIINRSYQKNIDIVNQLNLPDELKQDAISKLTELHNEQLALQAKSVNPYVSGVARLMPEQKSGKSADLAVNKGVEIDKYMYSLQEHSRKNDLADKNKRISNAIKEAEKNGLRKITVDDVTWYKARKNWSTKPPKNWNEQQNANIPVENNQYNFSQTTQQTQTAENSQQPILPNQIPDMGGFTQSM